MVLSLQFVRARTQNFHVSAKTLEVLRSCSNQFFEDILLFRLTCLSEPGPSAGPQARRWQISMGGGDQGPKISPFHKDPPYDFRPPYKNFPHGGTWPL